MCPREDERRGLGTGSSELPLVETGALHSQTSFPRLPADTEYDETVATPVWHFREGRPGVTCPGQVYMPPVWERIASWRPHSTSHTLLTGWPPGSSAAARKSGL